MTQDKDDKPDSNDTLRFRAKVVAVPQDASAMGEVGASLSSSDESFFTIQNWHTGTYWTKYPPSLPADYYQAIGEICQRWAWLEFQSGVLAREVLRLDKPAGYALTGGMSMRSISTVLEALSLGKYLDKHPAIKSRLNELAVKLGKLGDLRNEYAHGIWGYQRQGDNRLGLWKFKKPEDRMEPNWVHKPINALQTDAETLMRLQETAQRLTRDLKTASRGK